MKKLLIYLSIFIMFTGMANAEWLACDIPDAAQNVVSYAVYVDLQPEVIVPYRLNAAQDAVLLIDITDIDSATFRAIAINDQGRRSDFSDPFVLKSAPSALSGYRIVLE